MKGVTVIVVLVYTRSSRNWIRRFVRLTRSFSCDHFDRLISPKKVHAHARARASISRAAPRRDGPSHLQHNICGSARAFGFQWTRTVRTRGMKNRSTVHVYIYTYMVHIHEYRDPSLRINYYLFARIVYTIYCSIGHSELFGNARENSRQLYATSRLRGRFFLYIKLETFEIACNYIDYKLYVVIICCNIKNYILIYNS